MVFLLMPKLYWKAKSVLNISVLTDIQMYFAILAIFLESKEITWLFMGKVWSKNQ